MSDTEQQPPTPSPKPPLPLDEAVKFPENREFVRQMLDEYCDRINFQRQYERLTEQFRREQRDKRKR